MGQDFRKLRALAALLPAGALGMSISLASAGAMAMASPGPVQADLAKPASVALRLQAIRNSVSEVLDHAAKDSNDPAADRETHSPGGATVDGETGGTDLTTDGATAASSRP